MCSRIHSLTKTALCLLKPSARRDILHSLAHVDVEYLFGHQIHAQILFRWSHVLYKASLGAPRGASTSKVAVMFNIVVHIRAISHLCSLLKVDYLFLEGDMLEIFQSVGCKRSCAFVRIPLCLCNDMTLSWMLSGRSIVKSSCTTRVMFEICISTSKQVYTCLAGRCKNLQQL